MTKTFEQLRKQHPVFYYHSYSFEKKGSGLLLKFDFRIDGGIRFFPCVNICKNSEYEKFHKNNSLDSIENFVFHIGMIELISYWKCCCCPEIRIETACLDEDALAWWKNLYYNGLGEFFYVNNIKTDKDNFVKLSCTSSKKLNKTEFDFEEAYIVPIGGGKDSALTLEVLKKTKPSPVCMIINPRVATIETVKTSGLSQNYLEIKRPIDKKLLKLNAEGYLNGHTPFSAMLAFYSILLSALSGRKYIALSNESSANEPTIKNTNVNHQYSKSFAFESDFRSYVGRYIQKNISYFSFLRPVSELQIANLFAKLEKYHGIFKSCNVGSKMDQWCGHCSKCLFTFIILSPFLEAEKLEKIFGKNLFCDETLIPVLRELCGETEVKPFECVGTREEVCMSLCQTLDKYDKPPVLLEYFSHTELYEFYKQKDFQVLLKRWDNMNFLPENAEKILKKELFDSSL